jgi:hypothetical protein
MKILKFNEFSAIFEEELPMPEIPMDLSMTGEPAPAVPAGNGEIYKILFINANKEWAAEYPTGGGIKKYKHYEIKANDLAAWLEEIKLTDQAQEIKDGLSGKEELTKDQFFKLKQGLRDKTLKYKELAEVEVEYDEDGTPYTADLNVTFLKPTSDKDDNA